MTASGRDRKAGGRTILAVAVSLVAAVALLATPSGISVLQRVASRVYGTAPGPSAAPATKQLWTCGMHPQVIEDHPGTCPICGMKLVPLRGDGKTAASGGTGGTGGTGDRKVLFYRNPMDPTVTSPVPMKDSMGMDYVPVYADESKAANDGPVVTIDPAVVQNAGVVTQTIARRDISRTIRTVGYLDYDQEAMVSVTTKYDGFVEKVYVNYVGQPVRKGDPLFDVYSPSLVQTEQELLSALDFARKMKGTSADAYARAQALVDAARMRLAYWDVPKAQVERLESERKVFRTLTHTAPASGIVMKRMNGLEGMAIRPGMEVMHIANLSTLWLRVEVFEDQLAWIGLGGEAKVSLSYFPGETFHGRVRYIEPEVSTKTRTVTLKLEVPNPKGRLRSGMYATVEFAPVVAHDVVAVPSQSVIRTGERNVVVVALGGGRFAPRDVTLGAEGDDWIEVKSGLAAGDTIVVSSQFLIDSESNLRAAVAGMRDRPAAQGR